MAIARIFLFLSIIRFAFAAPAVVREVHEIHKVHVNVADVAEDWTCTSQKRWGPWLTNAKDQKSVRSIPAPQRLQDLTELDSVPSGPASSTGLRPVSRDDSTPRSSLSSPNYSPIQWLPDQHLTSSPEYSQPSWLSTDYSPSASSTSTDNSHRSVLKSHRSDSDNSHPSSSRPPRPTELETEDFLSQPIPRDPPRDPPSPAEFETQDFIGQLSSGPSPLPESGPSHPPEPETKNFIGQLGLGPPPLPEPRPSHPPEPETKDFIGQLGPGPPPLPEPETKDFLSQFDSGPSPLAEPEVKDFLGLFLSGRLMRRNSGSGVANLAQEWQATID